MRWQWLNNLPTEYQFSIFMGILMIACWASTPLSSVLTSGIGTLIAALSSLALGALAHGGAVRWKNNGSDKDLIGDAGK
jgi:hypothetical protein